MVKCYMHATFGVIILSVLHHFHCNFLPIFSSSRSYIISKSLFCAPCEIPCYFRSCVTWGYLKCTSKMVCISLTSKSCPGTRQLLESPAIPCCPSQGSAEGVIMGCWTKCGGRGAVTQGLGIRNWAP